MEVFTKDINLVKGLNAAARKMKAFASGVAAIGTSIAGMGTKMLGWGAAMLAPLAAGVKAFLGLGDSLSKMSDRTGISVEALSELTHAANLSGTDTETFENGIRKMQKSLVDAATGTKESQEAIQRLGLSIDHLMALSPDEQFSTIAEALSRVQDPTQRAAMAMEIFGKSGTKLLPMIAGGAKGIEDLRKRARDLGYTMSGEDAAAAVTLLDLFTDLWGQVKVLAFQVGAALAPALTTLARQATGVGKSMIDWIKANRAAVTGFALMAGSVLSAGAATWVLGKGIGLVSLAIRPAAFLLSGLASSAGMAARMLSGGLGIAGRLARAGLGAVGLAGRAATAVLGGLASGVGVAVSTLGSLAGGAISAVTAAFDVGVRAAVFFGRGVATVVPVVHGAMTSVAALIDTGMRSTVAVVQGAVAAIPGLIRAIPGALAAIPDLLATAGGAVYSALAAGASMAANTAAAAWRGLIAIPGLLSSGFSASAGIVSTIWAAAAGVASTAWSILTNLPAILTAAYTASAAAVNAAWVALPGLIASAWSAFVAALPAILTVAAIAGAAVLIYYLGRTVWPVVIDAARKAFETVGATVSGVFRGAVSAAESVAGSVASVFGQAVDSVRNTFSTLFSGIWDAAQGFFGDCAAGFENVMADGQQAFRVIAQALAQGDLSAAFSVVVALLKLEWARLTGWLTEKWIAFKGAWTETILGFQLIWNDVVAAIKTAWTEMIGFLTKAWTDFKNSGFTEWMANLIAPIMAKATGQKTEDVKRTLTEDFQRSRAAAPNYKAEIDAETARRKAEIESQRQQYAEGKGQEASAAAAARAREEQANQAAVEEAQRRYQDTLRDIEQELAPPPWTDIDEADFLEWLNTEGADQVAAARGGGIDYAKTEEAKTAVSGTFNPFAAFGMGGGTAAERTAKATERTAEAAEDTRDELHDLNSRLEFA